MSDVSSAVNHFPTANEGFITTLGSTISSGATTVPLTSTSGLTNGTIFVGIIEPGVDNKEQTFTGVVDTSGTQITGVKWTRGANTGHNAGVTIVDYVTGTHINLMTKGLQVEHSQDGTHAAVTTDSIVNAGTYTGSDAVTAPGFVVTGQTTGLLGAVHYYTYDGTDIFVDGVDQNNAANTISWTKPTNLKFVEVEVVGGGGGSGGADNTDSTGGGGGGGGYSYKKIAAASLGATETITVGAGGTAGAGTGGNGGAGGNSSFGAHAVGNGGSGGQGASAGGGGDGGAGGAASAGNINISGQSGDAGRVSSPRKGGFGGSSRLGFGAFNFTTAGGGVAGQVYGGGAAGAAANSTSDRVGAVGAAGIVIVKEYF